MAHDRQEIRSEKNVGPKLGAAATSANVIVQKTRNEINKYEGRFGKIRDEEETLAVKKLMFESLLNYRFRGTSLPCEELLIVLEIIIIEKP